MVIIYIISYFFLVLFFLIEKFFRKGDDAKTLKKTEYDKASTKLSSITFIVSCLILIYTPVLNYFQIGTIHFYIGFNILGLLIMLSGIIIRIIAVATLGKFYMRTLRKTENHELMTDGIYKYIRHPGYFGTILVFLGLGIAMGNAVSFVVTTMLMLINYTYRINVEEKMLNDLFGEKYKQYSKKTKRLIPFIY
jgi:protein-S-isoprenylcysteine O-methyltransferase Ste14